MNHTIIRDVLLERMLSRLSFNILLSLIALSIES